MHWSGRQASPRILGSRSVAVERCPVYADRAMVPSTITHHQKGKSPLLQVRQAASRLVLQVVRRSSLALQLALLRFDQVANPLAPKSEMIFGRWNGCRPQ